MTRKFMEVMKRQYSSTPVILLNVGRQLEMLSADSSYVESRPAAGISHCSMVEDRRSKWTVVQY